MTFAEEAVIRFKNALPEQQRGILLSLGWNLSIKDKQLDLTRESWIEPVKQIAKGVNEHLSASEPLSSLSFKAELEKFLNSTLMCSLLQDVRNFFITNPTETYFSITDKLDKLL